MSVSPHSSEADLSMTVAARIIHAVNDITPYPEGKDVMPFMYWDPEDDNSAALALFKRYVSVVVSFVICVVMYKDLILRDNNNIPLKKCECLQLFFTVSHTYELNFDYIVFVAYHFNIQLV